MPRSSSPIPERVACPQARRVVLLADTHGHLDERVAEVAATCDCVVHAGDIGAAAVMDALARPGHSFVAVLGNNDVGGKWVASERHLLESLPAEASVALPGGELVVVHGHKAGPARGRHAWLRRRYPNARMVVYGHSHRLVVDLDGAPWVVNPGGAGRARTYGGPSCLVLSVTPGDWGVESFRFPPVERTRAKGRGA